MNALKFLLTPYAIFELVLIYFFVSAYGFGAFFLEVVASGILGLFLIFRAGFSQLFSVNGLFGLVGSGNVLGALGFGMGGFLLLLPGLMSDILGVFVILVAVFTGSKFKNTQNNTQDYTYYHEKWRSDGFYRQSKGYQGRENFRTNNSGQNSQNGEIIDVEVIDEAKSLR